MILAIDPGTTQSGWCWYDPAKRVPLAAGVMDNPTLLFRVSQKVAPGQLHRVIDTLAIEMVASYGMPVGREVFETVRWIGRFQQAWRAPEAVRLIYRRDVKLHLCGSMKAKDANVWQALLDKLGPVGTKKTPGPLYGVTSHARSALAVAVTAAETNITARTGEAVAHHGALTGAGPAWRSNSSDGQPFQPRRKR